MALTVLAGSAFCVSDDQGDVADGVDGFYVDDTRHLSRLLLLVDGERPQLLTSRLVEHFSGVVFARRGTLLVRRSRLVDGGLHEEIVLENGASSPVSTTLSLELAADFADAITVKEHELTDVLPVAGRALPQPGSVHADGERLVLGETDGAAQTQVVLSRPARLDGGRLEWIVELAPRARWELRLDIAPLPEHAQRAPAGALAGWRARVPRLRASWGTLALAYDRSTADLAALRLDDGVPAAGAPWFMTVFGRDSIIASLQTLLLGPETAIATLQALTELQATVDDPTIDAEPGKIVHEVRHGRAAQVWFPRYYGSVDATPLYLVLFSELWRWTDDRALADRFKEPALAALAWIDEHGDRDGDGFVEYEHRTPRGLPNQSWKDSHDSQRFADGRLAQTPIAPCEVQGYVFDAKSRLAELAREAWGEPALAERLEREARELRDRFDAAYWVDRRGGYYALALDGEKRQVDALSSNIGQLLWSGIVPERRVDAVVDALLGDELWSGWGVRTMSAADAGYDPLGYHTGTVWPHDCSLIAQGFARYGRWREAQAVAKALVEAAPFFDGSLPEVFSGIARLEAPFPVAYPVSAHPQAWGAGAVVLLLQVLLGLAPNRRTRALETQAPGELPAWLGDVRLTGVRAFGRSWEARLEDGRVSVTAA
ncbi:MAG: amylo-alpha-1,6-glucosidase [Gaiellaceae bacterium]